MKRALWKRAILKETITWKRTTLEMKKQMDDFENGYLETDNSDNKNRNCDLNEKGTSGKETSEKGEVWKGEIRKKGKSEKERSEKGQS